ncbi:hypothetical protein FKM82_008150 [Ascaphus truei]
MDAVNAFNQELFALMDMKPPISRAKMIQITKAAIKAIKLYKHVVQIVEKFIKKCKPEYKVPGLYVIDSIVRQSRHQFGIEKDVFGPRFIKNLTETFQFLYLCPTEDKSKIVRVLNLWQKNGVFKIEIIQPLLDMAAGAVAGLLSEYSANEEGSPPPPVMIPLEPIEDAHNSVPAVSVSQLPSSDAFAAVAQLFQTSQGQQLQQILQTFQQPPKAQSPDIDENVLAQVQAITSQLQSVPSHQSERKTAFDKLLDRFDYDDEPDAAEEFKKEGSSPFPSPSHPSFTFPGDSIQAAAYAHISGQMPNMDQFQPHMMGMQQEILHHQAPLPPNGQMLGFGMAPTPPYATMVPSMVSQASPQPYQNPFQMQQNEMHMQKEHQQEMPMEVEQPGFQENKRQISEQHKSKSRSPKRRRSRSGSRPRRSRHRRSRSRSRDKRRPSPKSRSQERRDREKDRERRQKGLPQIKLETVSVCSTTLWVGQLDKRTTQQDVASLLEEFGPIESINMIPPRGCAYIVMVHRPDAFRALQKLSRGSFKVNQKAIKIAWALNKGIKSDYKQYWDVEIGVTYIPWSKVKPDELENFCEGGMLDNDTVCPEWKGFPKKAESNDISQNGGAENAHKEEISPLPQTLPMLSVPIHAPMPGMPVPPHQQMPPHQPLPSIPPHQVVPGIPGHPPVPLLPHQGMMPPHGMPHLQGMPPPQGMPHPQPVPGVGGLQPPTFTCPINIPPPGYAHGVPPPPPPPFMRPGFNPIQMPPGFLPPPGLPPPMTPLSMPPPTTGLSIPTSTAGGTINDPSKDQPRGNPIALAPGRENVESGDNGKGFGSAPQGGQNNAPGPMNPVPLLGAPQGPPHGPPSVPSHGPPGGPSQGPPGGPSHGPPHGPPGGPHHGPPGGPHHGPPDGPHHGPPDGPHHGPPGGPHHGPHHGPPGGPHHGPHGGPHHGPHGGPHHGPPGGPHHGPPDGPHHGPRDGPHHGPPDGPHHGPPGGPHHGPPDGPHHGPMMGLQAPSTGLLGARPGLIPLHRPPGVPPPHLQRFPVGPHRPMNPHMMHRGPPPRQGGFGMPPPHGMRGPFPPQGHFGGPGGHGGPDDREGRQFRNDRQGFNPNREERFGRRPYGNRNEEDRERFGNRLEERDHERPSNRGRRDWGRSPEHERHRDSEERNRWSTGRDREPQREMRENRENKKSNVTDLESGDKSHESFSRMGNANAVSELHKEKSESSGQKPAEEMPSKVTSSAEPSEKDSGSIVEAPR